MMTNQTKSWHEEFDKEFACISHKEARQKWVYEKVEAFITKTLAEQEQRIRKLIMDEIFICHKEGTPTSRLTSLAVKIEVLNKEKH